MSSFKANDFVGFNYLRFDFQMLQSSDTDPVAVGHEPSLEVWKSDTVYSCEIIFIQS